MVLSKALAFFILSLSVGLSARDAAAQTAEEIAARKRNEEYDRREKEAARKAAEAQRQRDLGKSAINNVAPRQLFESTRVSVRQIDLLHFLDAFEEFQAARLELANANHSGISLKPQARKIRKSAPAILEYLKAFNKTPAKFEPGELLHLTSTQLDLEFLSTTQRVGTQLEAMFTAEKSGEVEIELLTAIPVLRVELQQLQWMAKRLK
jgi:hypothetical protein